MLGPGTTVTHAAIRTLAESDCLVLWTGEDGVRLYAEGRGHTRSAANVLRQARLWADPASHLAVVRRLYQMRFQEALDERLTLEQIRGKEGVRVREAYARASRETGVTWKGRSYRGDVWDAADPINRALSCANSCLYGLCHAAIVAMGYSPALGFIHTGKLLSFVYDIADLYKTDVTVPVAFLTVADGAADLEHRVRGLCRALFRRTRLLERIVPDLDRALGVLEPSTDPPTGVDGDPSLPGGLWDPEQGEVPGGQSYGQPSQPRG
jgi:CRISPR-associated protein Cas1